MRAFAAIAFLCAMGAAAEWPLLRAPHHHPAGRDAVLQPRRFGRDRIVRRRAHRDRALDYWRDDALNSRSYFTLSKAPYQSNQFGGTFGGPLLPNQAFFFGDYQGLRLDAGAGRKP
jgi:hypothetical protein